MWLDTGKFENPGQHHAGWFRLYRFSGITEIWFGKRWIAWSWYKK